MKRARKKRKSTSGHHDAPACAVRKLKIIREILFPRGNPDASWSPDTIDEVARVVGHTPCKR